MQGHLHAPRPLVAIGLPVGGLGIFIAGTALTTYGPRMLVGNWAGQGLLLVLFLSGFGLVTCTPIRYHHNFVTCVVAQLTLAFGMLNMATAMQDQEFLQHDKITTCVWSRVMLDVSVPPDA